MRTEYAVPLALSVLLSLLAPVVMQGAPGISFHISFRSLQQLDTISSSRIESLDDAAAYVRKAAVLCGITDPALLPGGLESRLATAEWEAARDPTKLVPDDQVAKAFNFMSGEFRVKHPAELTAEDILQYRSVQAALFPHMFSPKGVNGSRPVSAVVILYLLWFNGGVTVDVRKAAQLDRQPGSLTISPSGGRSGLDPNPNLAGREYQAAGYAYFVQQPPQRARSFLDHMANTVSLPQDK